jgi:transcriptional regulator with XRE-family HTH domain
MMPNRALCEALFEAKLQGRNQLTIAKESGVPSQMISQYKTGKTPTVKTARKLARVLRRSIDDLFPEEALTDDEQLTTVAQG